MAAQYNYTTKEYEVYSTLEGAMVPTGKPLDSQDRDENYCGTCKTDPCMVADGQACCHTYVTYGYCQHNPLPDEDEE